MAKVATNISIDADLKAQSMELFSELGMDLSTAVNLFLRQAVRIQGLPFPVVRDVPNPETISALKEREDMLRQPERYPRYSSFREAMNEVLSDA